MKLLYIDTYIPYPLNNGGSQAFFTISDHVRQQHDLSVLLYVHNSREKENVEQLKKLWPNVTFYIFERDTEKQQVSNTPSLDPNSGMSWYDRKLCKTYDFLGRSMQRKIARKRRKYDAGSFGGKTESIKESDIVRNNSTLFMGTIDLTPSFCNYVHEVASKGFDVVQIEFYDYLPLVYILPKEIKKVFVHHELRFVRNENEIGLYKKPLPTDRILLEQKKAEELAALNAYDAVITLTEIDKEILSHYLPEDKIFASPAITHTVTYEHKSFAPAKELVFVGNGDHFPNADGMVWFCQEVVPMLQTKGVKVPAIHITGNWNEKLKTGLKQLCPSVNFVGYVDDLQSFLNGKISIVPIRIGSGMRMKILDSVFAAAPLVTTSKGCEGLPFFDNDNCLIADTTEAFANALEKMLSDVELQQRLAIKAQNSKTNMLNEEALYDKRVSVYTTLLDKK